MERISISFFSHKELNFQCATNYCSTNTGTKKSHLVLDLLVDLHSTFDSDLDSDFSLDSLDH